MSMRATLFVGWITLAVIVIPGPLTRADEPSSLASHARLDLLAEQAVGELRLPRLTRGDGEADRMDWLESAAQPRSITADFVISPLAWRPFELRFTPAGSGTVQLHLLGPFKQQNKLTLKQEVFWDSLSAQGAELANGSFEQLRSGETVGWRSQGGRTEAASLPVTAQDGQRVARTWHDERLVATLHVAAEREVVLRGFARAIFPAGFREMPRIQQRNTPAHQAAAGFRRGVNLGNYLEAPPGQDWGARYNAADFDRIQAEGFDHVRIPVGWQHATSREPAYTIHSAMFEKVDALVNHATARDLNVMVNVHHFDAFTTDPLSERPRLLAIWRQLAEHYQDAPAGVAFELLNEPKDAATTEVLNEIYAELIREIRRTNPRRTIFVGPGSWNSADELPQLWLPPDEQNVIVSIHCYLPFYFTHQGASWVGPDAATTGIRFPGPPREPLVVSARRSLKPSVRDWITRYNTLPTDQNPSSPLAFEAYLKQAKEWSDYYGRPVHVGEFGCIDLAAAESRANYLRAVRQQLETDEIGWCLWDWKARFRYWDVPRRQPQAGLHEALFGR